MINNNRDNELIKRKKKIQLNCRYSFVNKKKKKVT